MRIKRCSPAGAGSPAAPSIRRAAASWIESSAGGMAQQPVGCGIAAEEERGEAVEIGLQPDVDLEGAIIEYRRIAALEGDQQRAVAARRAVEGQAQGGVVEIRQGLARQSQR